MRICERFESARLGGEWKIPSAPDRTRRRVTARGRRGPEGAGGNSWTLIGRLALLKSLLAGRYGIALGKGVGSSPGCAGLAKPRLA